MNLFLLLGALKSLANALWTRSPDFIHLRTCPWSPHSYLHNPFCTNIINTTWYFPFERPCVSVFQYIHWIVNCHHYLIPEHFKHPEKDPVPVSTLSGISSPIPRPPPVCFLSFQMGLIWPFHINWIIWYTAFCVWLLTLSMTFARFIHVVVCQYLTRFHGWIKYSAVWADLTLLVCS